MATSLLDLVGNEATCNHRPPSIQPSIHASSSTPTARAPSLVAHPDASLSPHNPRGTGLLFFAPPEQRPGARAPSSTPASEREELAARACTRPMAPSRAPPVRASTHSRCPPSSSQHHRTNSSTAHARRWQESQASLVDSVWHGFRSSLDFEIAMIFPSLMQLEHGMSDSDDWRQRAACSERYRRRDEPEDSKRPISEIDAEIEEECRICMELNSRVVLRNCSHDMCIKCYHQCLPMYNFFLICFTFKRYSTCLSLKSASGHGGSADAAGATKEEEGYGGLPATEGKLSHLEHIRGSNEVCTTWFLPLGQYQMC
ncbi:unnamed protein product [Triticum turgidum subsp. durum]|uniref:RING-type domain-containing protein n=1 Tax=Triticum turgidum subsp. durum TaxID=4567 RepID=A0A9R1R868_TRITD|nr:unnamed protein product [Triticum turgidum subsp. durum]